MGNNSGNGVGEGIWISGGSLVSRNIIVRNGTAGNPGTGIACESLVGPTLTCNDSWGNGIDGFAGCDTTSGQNFSADPFFCNESQETFLLNSRSPCAPAQGSPCGLVGAFGVGCRTDAVEEKTWGEVKRLYR